MVHWPKAPLPRSRRFSRIGGALLTVAIVSSSCIERDDARHPAINDRIDHSTRCPSGFAPRDPVAPEILAAFPGCGDGTAHFIPDFLIPESFHDRLEKGPEGALCVPDIFATDPLYTPKHCESLLGVRGACLPAVLPEVAAAKVPLPTGTCAWNERCVPCMDPETMEDTGACDLGDMACEPPVRYHDCQDLDFDPAFLANFPTCCDLGAAHCAPKEMVVKKDEEGNEDPASLRLADKLDTCDNGDGYCVPDQFLGRAGRFHPVSCRSIGGREGRCLSVCIPEVAAELDQLPQSTCFEGERCAPCYDPRTGESTGVCSVGRCDEPREAPDKFDSCGTNDDAFCIPTELIPASERRNFDRQGCGSTCTEPGTLCVPKKMMDQGATFSPPRCKSKSPGFLGGLLSFFQFKFGQMGKFSEGRCLPKCLPAVRPSAKQLKRDGCDESELCVPCYDPRQASKGLVPTGACDR